MRDGKAAHVFPSWVEALLIPAPRRKFVARRPCFYAKRGISRRGFSFDKLSGKRLFSARSASVCRYAARLLPDKRSPRLLQTARERSAFPAGEKKNVDARNMQASTFGFVRKEIRISS